MYATVLAAIFEVFFQCESAAAKRNLVPGDLVLRKQFCFETLVPGSVAADELAREKEMYLAGVNHVD
jgi:hypothetical protein